MWKIVNSFLRELTKLKGFVRILIEAIHKKGGLSPNAKMWISLRRFESFGGYRYAYRKREYA